MIRVVLAVIITMLSLQGCIYSGPIKKLLAPIPFQMGVSPDGKDAPKGTPAFKLGWKHGCETGLSTMATDYYKTFWKYQQDPSMIENKEYYKAWKDSYSYCRHYSFRWVLWKWDADTLRKDIQ